jgi:hypothetical protein
MNTNTTSQDIDYDNYEILNAHDDSSYTPEQLEEAYQRMEDDRFNSSVWEDWEAKVDAEIKRDQMLNTMELDAHWRL